MDDQLAADFDDFKLSKILAKEPVHGRLGPDHCWIRSNRSCHLKCTCYSDHALRSRNYGDREDDGRWIPVYGSACILLNCTSRHKRKCCTEAKISFSRLRLCSKGRMEIDVVNAQKIKTPTGSGWRRLPIWSFRFKEAGSYRSSSSISGWICAPFPQDNRWKITVLSEWTGQCQTCLHRSGNHRGIRHDIRI